ncbi:MAG: hypothetical protein U5O39_09385 [Gammaproteobacteria bacterium]|nr:hypothetical protein [Gammaproteobacteria bacterium]
MTKARQSRFVEFRIHCNDGQGSKQTIDIDTDNDGIEDQTLVTLSDQLSVNTGIADQNSMSISSSQFALEGENEEGTKATITIRLADLFNNPVRDGTTVQFRTEYGSIQPSCNTSEGVCSVAADVRGTPASAGPECGIGERRYMSQDVNR